MSIRYDKRPRTFYSLRLSYYKAMIENRYLMNTRILHTAILCVWVPLSCCLNSRRMYERLVVKLEEGTKSHIAQDIPRER